MIVFQDTNALCFKAIPSFVGCTINNKIDFNFMSVKRIPKESVGTIVDLKTKYGIKHSIVN